MKLAYLIFGLLIGLTGIALIWHFGGAWLALGIVLTLWGDSIADAYISAEKIPAWPGSAKP